MSRQSGFTLIELMMVVLVMGFGLTLVTLALNQDGSSQARDETEEFIRRAEFAAEQSLLTTQIMGLFVEPRGQANSLHDRWCYSWQRWRNYAWEPIEVLAEYCLPESLQLELVVETETWTYDAKRSPQPPVLVFQPSGESTRLELAIAESNLPGGGDPDQVQRIDIDMLGQIRWLNREAELAQNQRSQ